MNSELRLNTVAELDVEEVGHENAPYLQVATRLKNYNDQIVGRFQAVFKKKLPSRGCKAPFNY